MHMAKIAFLRRVGESKHNGCSHLELEVQQKLNRPIAKLGSNQKTG
jgi:hypothetical protein